MTAPITTTPTSIATHAHGKPPAVPGKKTKEQLRHLPPSAKQKAELAKDEAATAAARAATGK